MPIQKSLTGHPLEVTVLGRCVSYHVLGLIKNFLVKPSWSHPWSHSLVLQWFQSPQLPSLGVEAPPISSVWLLGAALADLVIDAPNIKVPKNHQKPCVRMYGRRDYWIRNGPLAFAVHRYCNILHEQIHTHTAKDWIHLWLVISPSWESKSHDALPNGWTLSSSPWSRCLRSGYTNSATKSLCPLGVPFPTWMCIPIINWSETMVIRVTSPYKVMNPMGITPAHPVVEVPSGPSQPVPHLRSCPGCSGGALKIFCTNQLVPLRGAIPWSPWR